MAVMAHSAIASGCRKNVREIIGLVPKIKLPSMTGFVLQAFVLSLKSNQTCLTIWKKVIPNAQNPYQDKSRRNKSRTKLSGTN
jgi:hypothetical protein